MPLLDNEGRARNSRAARKPSHLCEVRHRVEVRNVVVARGSAAAFSVSFLGTLTASLTPTLL